VPELSAFRNDENYKLAVSTIQGRASKWAAMGYYNHELIMKQEQSLDLEVAAVCANDQTMYDTPLGSAHRLSGKPACLPCSYLKDDMMSSNSLIFSVGSRANSCDSCANAYSGRNSGGVTGLFYGQYCKGYVPPAPPPVPVTPITPVVIIVPPNVDPDPTPFV
jgi:hypothetical protein